MTSFESAQELIEQLLADLRGTLGNANVDNTDSDTLKQLGAEFLKTYCSIDLDNDDTGAITGYDAKER